MALSPAFTQIFTDQLNGEYATEKDKILECCDRLCENPRALNAKRLKYDYSGCRSADVPGTGGGGRGKDRIIFRLNDDLNQNIPKDQILFCFIADYHKK